MFNTFWANYGFVSEFIAKKFPYRDKPILVISIPRSGSSMVGNVLGHSPDVLYLREPVTQTFLKDGFSPITRIREDNPPKLYLKFANKAFSAIPCFSGNIVQEPEKWKLWRRNSKFLLIKEVNPLAIRFFQKCYKPKIIFLLRYPAAVALSYHRLGWFRGLPEEFLWYDIGVYQGYILKYVENCLETLDDLKIIFFEDICNFPKIEFKSIYEFCGLSWGREVELFIESITSVHENGPYSTSKNSKEKILEWKNILDRTNCDEIWKGYKGYRLPWYTEDQW